MVIAPRPRNQRLTDSAGRHDHHLLRRAWLHGGAGTSDRQNTGATPPASTSNWRAGHDLILDAGTGIRLLGNKARQQVDSRPTSCCHTVTGTTFRVTRFLHRSISPIATSTCTSVRRRRGTKLLSTLFEQMDGTHFPVQRGRPAVEQFRHVQGDRERAVRARGHQGGQAGAQPPRGRLCLQDRRKRRQPSPMSPTMSSTHPMPVSTNYDEWVNYLHGVDVLIHDAQYTEDDMPHKHGWGHSLLSQVRQLATDAEVGTLVMFHHDPDRSDSQLDEIQIENQIYLKSHRAPARSVCAAEGMRIHLSKPVLGGDPATATIRQTVV